MKTVEILLKDIKPYENNPRYNDNAVDAVAKSIEEFGFQQPIVLDKNNVIIVGHTRYKASIKLGLETVPCVIADNLTEDQVKAYRLADNKVGEISVWDHTALNIELGEIEMDMSDFGFFDIDTDYLSDFFDAESTAKPVSQNEEDEEQEEEKEKVYKVVVEFNNKEEAEEFMASCKEENLKCKMGE